MSEFLVWCEPVHRRELRLAEGDIARAMSFFQEKTGQTAREITLHPKNEKYASEVPAGIEVTYYPGCLAWEIWLSLETNSSEKSIVKEAVLSETGEIPSKTVLLPMTAQGNKTSAAVKAAPGQKVMPVRPSKDKGGRPKKELPIARIKKLSKKMGVKAVAKQLKMEGIEVSAMTVSRVLKGTDGGATKDNSSLQNGGLNDGR